MKFSTWLALGAIIGREIVPGERNWKDKVLWAIVAKNEALDKDGIVRKLVTQGATDGEIAELKQMLANQQKQQYQQQQHQQQQHQQQCVESAPRKKGFFAGFVRGWRGEPL